MNMQTPGVHIQELNAFPNSMVEVASAVPVFIGYTRNTVVARDGSLINNPRRITLMAECQCLFGAPPEPFFSLQAVVSAARAFPLAHAVLLSRADCATAQAAMATSFTRPPISSANFVKISVSTRWVSPPPVDLGCGVQSALNRAQIHQSVIA